SRERRRNPHASKSSLRFCCTSTQQPWHGVVVRRQARGASFNAALRGGLSSAACDNLSISPDSRAPACVGYCTESACESEHPLTDRPPASVSRIPMNIAGLLIVIVFAWWLSSQIMD